MHLKDEWGGQLPLTVDDLEVELVSLRDAGKDTDPCLINPWRLQMFKAAGGSEEAPGRESIL